jgi:hypothetical protein
MTIRIGGGLGRTQLADTQMENVKVAKSYMLLATVAVLCCGCTTTSLKMYTLDQIRTVEDYRINAALECLATIAASPDTLPSFALLTNGGTHLQDMGTVMSNTTWTRALHGFAMDTFTLSASRAPMGQWTVDPVVAAVQLSALRAACRWVVSGPESAWNESPGLLLDPATDYAPLQPHFGVADKLARLPPNWLHVSSRVEVPKNALYKGHCGETWVWVLPEDEQYFSEFILILHDIATIHPDIAVYSSPLIVIITRQSPAFLNTSVSATTPATTMLSAASTDSADSFSLSEPMPTPEMLNSTLVKSKANPNTKPNDKTDSAGSQMLTYNEYRVVRPEYRQRIECALAAAHNSGSLNAGLTESQWLEATYPFTGSQTAAKVASTGAGTPQIDLPYPVNSQGVMLNPTIIGPGRLGPAPVYTP